MRLQAPEQFEQFLQPVGGDVRVRPARGSRFDVDIHLAHLNRMGLFTVRADSLKVDAEPSHQFFGITIPLNSPFTCNDKTERQVYTPGTAHVLQPTERFSFSAADGCRVLVCNIFLEPLQTYAQRLTQGDNEYKLETAISLVASQPEGAALQRAVARTWTRLLNSNVLVETDLSIKELEDELIAQFLLLTNIFRNVSEHVKNPCPVYMGRVEEYLCANLELPVTRDSIAAIAGVS